MKSKQFRQWIALFVVLVASVFGKVSAQTFYELHYTDKQGYENYGLMFYFDEEDCTLILRRQTADGNDISVQTLEYVSESSDPEDDENYLIMACEDDNTPIFIWIWDQEESQEQQLVPYIALNSDDDVDQWVRANSCQEVYLRQLTPEYISQYIEEGDELYELICMANSEAINSYNQCQEQQSCDVESLGDGSGVFGSISTSVDENSNNQPDPNNNNPTMHMIVVANTEVADIGAACRVDYNNITSEMRGIAQSIGIRMKEYNVAGGNYSKSSMIKQLSALRQVANDIVFFLYTGHGFRFDNQTDVYPMMSFTTNDYQNEDNNYTALSDVYNEICKKGARLNIVLSDCCNSNAGVVNQLQGNTLFTRSNNNFSRSRLSELFLKAKGSILSTAASPGEYSWCDSSGGMFTLSFIQSLRKEVSAMNTAAVDWQSIIDNTIKTALQRSINSAKAQNGIKSVKVVKL